MKHYETAYGIASLVLIINMFQRSINNRTITRKEVLSIIEDSKKTAKKGKFLPFDEDTLAHVQSSLKLVEELLSPLDTGRGKVR